MQPTTTRPINSLHALQRAHSATTRRLYRYRPIIDGLCLAQLNDPANQDEAEAALLDLYLAADALAGRHLQRKPRSASAEQPLWVLVAGQIRAAQQRIEDDYEDLIWDADEESATTRIFRRAQEEHTRLLD